MLAYSVSGKYKLYNAKSAPGCVCAHFSLSADIYTCQKHVGKKKSKNVTTLSHSSIWIPLSIVWQFNAPLGIF